VYAAGDIARYPDPRSGERIRIEHWVHAQRQGRAAARNILGHSEPFTDTPFFWTKHFGIPVAYVGHAEDWEEVVVDGQCGTDEGCTFSFLDNGVERAFASVHRDTESLRKEAEMEETLPVHDQDE
jgi:NADPH-dependent 2,4-dienoyl-CoA reductase/sulfur reductase-like enzyme